jgi:hypothetical protein
MLYHRLESPTQKPADARKQEMSGELWGQAAPSGLQPKVKAYQGGLPDGKRGLEFTTDTPPDPGCPPGQAFWSGPRDGVEVSAEYAKIRIIVVKNTQV